MSEQYYEEIPRYHDYFTSGGQKLSVSRRPPLWQRLALAIFSLALWGTTILCFKLAWDWTWYYDSGITRGILVLAPLLLTPLLIFINLLFNRKR
jgi:hypothetical protein